MRGQSYLRLELAICFRNIVNASTGIWKDIDKSKSCLWFYSVGELISGISSWRIVVFIVRVGAFGADIPNWGRGSDFREAGPINAALRPGRKYRHSCVPFYTYALLQ